MSYYQLCKKYRDKYLRLKLFGGGQFCEIHQEPIEYPKAKLPCGHEFCERCITIWFE